MKIEFLRNHLIEVFSKSNTIEILTPTGPAGPRALPSTTPGNTLTSGVDGNIFYEGPTWASTNW